MMSLNPKNRVVALIDMDCFYVQVEQREKPELWGKPVAVVQYNQWKGGGLIAVGYEARPFGVKRGSMRGEEASALCPELTLCTVPVSRGKADLTKYRDASAQVFQVMNNFDEAVVVERASVDEAYLDLSKLVQQKHSDLNFEISKEMLGTTYIISSDPSLNLETWLGGLDRDSPDWRLACGAVITEQIRARILKDTQFHCSGGVANGKTFAKLVCGYNKPRKQTIIPATEIDEFYKRVKIDSVRNLGGKLGAVLMNDMHLETMHHLANVQLQLLMANFNAKTAQWLYDLSHGIDVEEVIPRDLTKSIGCSKNFYGQMAIKSKSELRKWLRFLCEELHERLVADQTANGRTARKLVVGLKSGTSLRANDEYNKSSTRQMQISSYSEDALFNAAYHLLNEFNNTDDRQSDIWTPPVVNLSIGAGKFEDCVDTESHCITDFFSKKPHTLRPSKLGCPVEDMVVNKELPSTGFLATTDGKSGNVVDEKMETALNSEPMTACSSMDQNLEPIEEYSSCILNEDSNDPDPNTRSSVEFVEEHENPVSIRESGFHPEPVENRSVETGSDFDSAKYLPKSLGEIDKRTMKALPLELQLELKGVLEPKKKDLTTKQTVSFKPKKSSPKKKKSNVPPKNKKIVDFFPRT